LAPAPAVSLVLPIRDAADTLRACLASIRAQTCGDYEVVAVDDGSTDDSASIVAAAAAEDARIRPIRQGRDGLVAALNRAIAEARAPLIARMDADDEMHPERLAAQVAYLTQHPDAGVVGTQVEAFPPEVVTDGFREYLRWQNACITPTEIADAIYVEAPLAHPTVMMRRAALQAMGGYAEGAFPEDYELWLRMHRGGVRMGKVARVLLRWRERPDRTSRVDPRYARGAFDRLRARYLAADPRLHAGRDVVVCGAGRRTRLRAKLLMDAGVRVAAWIDVDPRKIGGAAWGVPIHDIDWLAREPKPFVLIYIATHGARDAAAARLEQMGYERGEDYLPVG
jgi:glycosyltransferase involved in cell wall biosynthesis